MQTELVGIRSAPVPGRESIRADEEGGLWRWDDATSKWKKLPRKYRYFFRSATGAEVWVTRIRLYTSAWHGPKPSGWYAKLGAGATEITGPASVEWYEGVAGRSNTLPVAVQSQIRCRAKNGERLSALAREFKVSVAYVSVLCKNRVRRGPSVARTRWLTPADRAEIVRQRKGGAKLAAIAVRFKRSETRIRTILNEEAARASA